MNSIDPVDFAVIGGGLAGLAIADKLNEKGFSVVLIDKNEIAAGASGTPLGLVNPATGRFGTKSWEAENCYGAILQDLKKVQSNTSVSIFRKSGILRPALDENIAMKMRVNLKNTAWPDSWYSWIDGDELAEMNPDLNCVEGGLWLPIGLSVDIPAYLNEKAKQLQRRKVKIITGTEFKLSKNGNQFQLVNARGDKISTTAVIYAAGIQTLNSDFWNFLPLIAVKGQVAVFSKPEHVNLKESVSALGYIGSLSPKTFVIGSTYEHTFDHLKPDEKGLDYMKTRIKKVYPSLFTKAKLINQWAGIRASTPNRMPIIGHHPEIENLYIFTGLGSKGLLYSTYLAGQLCSSIINNSELPKEVTLGRFRHRN